MKKKRLTWFLLLAFALFSVALWMNYETAVTTAAQWKVLGTRHQDASTPDLDGMSPDEVQALVRAGTSGSADLARWPPSGGLLSLVVLEHRLHTGSLLHSYSLAGRIQGAAPDSTVGALAGEIHEHLLYAMVSSVCALLTLFLVAASVRYSRGKA